MSADEVKDEEETAAETPEGPEVERAGAEADERAALETLTADVVVEPVSDDSDIAAEESTEAVDAGTTDSEEIGIEAVDAEATDAEPSVAASLAEDGETAAAAEGNDSQATPESSSPDVSSPEFVDGEPLERATSPGDDLPQRTAELKSIVEALIFASPDPLTLKALCKLLDGEPKEDVAAAVAALKEDYERPSGLQFVEVAGGYQIVTRPDLHEWVRRLFHERSTQKLSVQALETLAVVAYRQPVTAIEITEIRGVNTSGVMNTLLERHLIKIVGRKQVVGRPFMYATTKEFLIRFGLKDLTDLPKVEDMAEALGIENPLLVERSPVDEQLPLEEPDEEGASVVEDAAAEDAADAAVPDMELDDDPSGSVH